MADFVAFGRGVIDMATTCTSGIDRADAAAFLCAQQKAIQNDRINARLAGQQQAKQGGKANNALERMRAMAGLK